jgi:sugar phosphate isomerase/epimerase
MNYSRRDFGKIALGAIPVASAVASGLMVNPTRLFAAAKPNSFINGVQIGTITYSFRSMPDQSAEATLQYVVDSGISAIELMGAPVDAYARKRANFTPSNAGGGRGGFGGGRGPGGPAPAPAPPGPAVAGQPSWNGQACPAGRGGGPGGAPGGGGGRGQQTPEQMAAAKAAADEVWAWQKGLSMDIFKDLRKMYNDAGVTIYAVKNLNVNSTDEQLDFQFTVGKTLGATHITAELPAHSDTSTATLKKVGDAALRNGMFAAYHSHLQGSMTAFAEAFAASAGNKSNIDFGHYVAAGEVGGTPMDFLTKYHDRIGSFHLKDRTLPQHCELNLAWGQGETPIKEILKLVQKNKWPLPATIEQEYEIPAGSDAVKEVQKCLAYCRAALA